MTKEKALEWLDGVVIAYRILYRELSEEIYDLEKNCRHEIQINGVIELAKAAGLPYTVRPWDGNDTVGTDHDEASFEYGGFRFFQLVHNE